MHSSFGTYPNAATYTNLLNFNSIIIDNFKNENISRDELDYERLQQSVSCVYIYFNDLNYVYIEQSPTRLFVDLLSSLGGTLGLFVGVSFLSFVEIFELLIEILYVFRDKRRQMRLRILQ